MATPKRASRLSQPLNVKIKLPGNDSKPKETAEPLSKQKKSCFHGIKLFCFPPAGVLKILRMLINTWNSILFSVEKKNTLIIIFIVGAVVAFTYAESHDPSIIVTVLEISIVLFFIILYMLTLYHLLLFIDWPLLDIINSLVTAVFLIIVCVLAIRETEKKYIFYTGGALSLAAAVMCLLDACLVTKNTGNKVEKSQISFKEKAQIASTSPSKTSKLSTAAVSLTSATPSRISFSRTSMKSTSHDPSKTSTRAPSINYPKTTS